MLRSFFKNKVAKNASWIIVCKLIQSVLGLVISLFTARYLGPSNFGIINYAISLTAFVLPIVELGITNVLVQEIVNHPEEEGKIIGTSLCLTFLSAIFCIGGLNLFVFLANRNEPVTKLVCALYSIILIFQAMELIRYWYQAKYIAKYTSIISLIAYLIVSGYKIFLLVTAKSIYWFAISNSLDYLIISLLSLILYKKLGGGRLKFSLNIAKRILSVSRFYIVSSLMVTIFAQTDKIMLKFLIDEASVGYYSAAVACAGMTSFIFGAIIDSFRPLIFESFKDNIERFELNMKRLYCIVIYFSILQSILMTALAGPLILILYGKNYSASINALRIVVWYTTFAYLGSVRNIWMLANGKQKYLWIINLLGALANVGLNFALIPFIGILGAAAASLITQLFTNVIVGYIIRPISYNNKLMVQALNPKYIFDMLKNKS